MCQPFLCYTVCGAKQTWRSSQTQQGTSGPAVCFEQYRRAGRRLPSGQRDASQAVTANIRRGGSGDAFLTKAQKKAWQEEREAFYASGPWIACARAYRKAHPLCERCLQKREISFSEECHHKEKLTPENINNPDITLNWDNIEALCGKCHRKEHKKQADRRWTVDENGVVTC